MAMGRMHSIRGYPDDALTNSEGNDRVTAAPGRFLARVVQHETERTNPYCDDTNLVERSDGATQSDHFDVPAMGLGWTEDGARSRPACRASRLLIRQAADERRKNQKRRESKEYGPCQVRFLMQKKAVQKNRHAPTAVVSPDACADTPRSICRACQSPWEKDEDLAPRFTGENRRGAQVREISRNRDPASCPAADLPLPFAYRCDTVLGDAL